MFTALKDLFPFSRPAPKARLWAPSERHDFRARFLDVMRGQVAKAPSFTWKSQFLRGEEVIGARKAARIVEQVFHDPKLQSEIGRIISRLGGVQSPKIWNLYFRRCYNAAEAMSQGYIQLLTTSHAHLPKNGIIYDCGGGPGNFSASLLEQGPNRRVKMFDMSPQALRLALDTARGFGVDDRLTRVRANLRKGFRDEGEASGAVMNNVLYTLGGYAQKLAFLKSVHSALKPGGVFVLSDCRPEFKSEKAFEQWIQQVVASALYHDSPMNAFDVALYAEINRKILIAGSAPFLSQDQLISLAHKAGFALIETPQKMFYGIDTVLVLRRGYR